MHHSAAVSYENDSLENDRKYFRKSTYDFYRM